MIVHTMKAVIGLACLVWAVSAHVCLLNPHQRGSMGGLNKKGASDCGLLVKPCGNRTTEKSVVQIKGGASYAVVFQKNLNHYVSYPNGTATNGYFEISFWTETQCHVLGKVADTNTPSLTLYAENVTMPDGPLGVPAILQLTYATNSPDVPEGHIFYQCADVQLF